MTIGRTVVPAKHARVIRKARTSILRKQFAAAARKYGGKIPKGTRLR